MNIYKVELAWSTPPANVTGHRVYWGLAAGDYPRSKAYGPEPVATIQVQAEVNDTIHLAVTATDASTGLESAFSQEITATAPPAPVVPEMPVVVAQKPPAPTGLSIIAITYVGSV